MADIPNTTRRSLFAAVFAAPLARIARAEDIPAYHKTLPKEPLPPTKDADQYIDRPVVQRVYQLAAKVRPVLYQQPCYCRCDKFGGHASLLDCFVDSHGEECGICQREAVFSYIQTRAGKSPQQIRAAIQAGDWKQVDMSMAALSKL